MVRWGHPCRHKWQDLLLLRPNKMLGEIDQEWKGQCSGMLLISGIQESRSEAEPGMMVARGWGSGKEEGLVRGNQLSVTQDE